MKNTTLFIIKPDFFMTMNFDGKKITIFGGNGFIGKTLISKLCAFSCRVEVVTRKKKNHNDLRFLGGLGQVNVAVINKFNEKEIQEIISDSDIVINLIGILFENKKQKFENVHVEIPKMIANVSKKLQIKYFIHLSALGVDKNTVSKYALSKRKGELEIIKIFSNSIIIRPSVVFGSEDNFINLFSKMSVFLPILPLLGTPNIVYKKKYFPEIDFKHGVNFQPIYVGDLADYIISTFGKKKLILDLAGPNIFSFKEILKLICKAKKIRRLLIPVPLFLAKILAFFLEKLPTPLLTIDQVKMLNDDNVSKEGYENLEKIIKHPKSLNIILPTYIN